VYHARPDDSTVGPAVLDELEKDGTLVATGLLGLSSEAWGPIHYFKYRSLTDLLAAGSPCNDRPCTLLFESGRIEVHSPATVDQHELVHSYDLSVGCAPPLFREGLAASVACLPVVEPEFATASDDHPSWLDGSWRDITDFSGPYPPAYPPAAVLVTWLVDQFGWPAFYDFYRALGCDSSQADIAAIFQAHYAVSLDSVWSSLVAAPRRRVCLSTWACNETKAIGSVTLSNQMTDYRLADPIPSGASLVTVSASRSALLPVVRPCTADGAMPGLSGFWPPYPDGFSPTVVVAGTTANVLALRDYGTADDPSARLDLSIVPLAAQPAGVSCSDVQPIMIDQQQGTALVWPQSAPVILHLQSSGVPDTSMARVRSYDGSGDLALETCSDCVGGELQNCALSGVGNELNAPWLRIQWSPAVLAPLSFSIQWQ
jgi:hypothetical protein